MTYGCRRCLTRLYFVCDWPMNFHPYSYPTSAGMGKIWRCPKCSYKALYSGEYLVHDE